MKKIFFCNFFIFIIFCSLYKSAYGVDAFFAESLATVELVGFSPDSSSFALRYIYGSYQDDKKESSLCNYPKINGLTPLQVTLLLHQAGKKDLHWIIYRNPLVDSIDIGKTGTYLLEPDKKKCTSFKRASQKLVEAKAAFKSADINLQLKGIPLIIKKRNICGRNKINFSENCIVINKDIMNSFYINTSLTIIPMYYLKEVVTGNGEDSLYGFAVDAPGYGVLTIHPYMVRIHWDQKTFNRAWLSPDKRSVVIISSRSATTDKPYVYSLPDIAARLLNKKGLALHRRKKYNQSEKFFEQAYQLDRFYYRALFNLACAQARLNKIKLSTSKLHELLDKCNDRKKYLKLIKKDKDLDNLRNEAEYKLLFK